MTYIVELRYIGGDLADLMSEMRAWLDHNRVEPEEFHQSSGPPGLAFRVGFGDEDDAAAFAEAFEGCLECADPQGAGGRWSAPHTPRMAHRRRSSTAKPARSRE